jgi:hypothetical protein
MNSLKRSNWMKYAALAVLGVSLGSRLANAQDVAGKFNLPFKARWGKLVLDPGKYSFTYGSLTMGQARVIRVCRGQRGVGMILTVLASTGQFSDSSHLTAVRVGGVTGLHLCNLQSPICQTAVSYYADHFEPHYRSILFHRLQPAHFTPL